MSDKDLGSNRLGDLPTDGRGAAVVSGPATQTAIVTGFYGMKCDAPECSWSDMTVPRAEYPAYRNKPCPNCGSNLLTDEDWNFVLSMEAATAWVNENAERLGLKTEGPETAFDVDFDAVKAAAAGVRTALETGAVGTDERSEEVNQNNQVIP